MKVKVLPESEWPKSEFYNGFKAYETMKPLIGKEFEVKLCPINPEYTYEVIGENFGLWKDFCKII